MLFPIVNWSIACHCQLQSALRLKPSFTDAYNNMASALVQKGLIPQAVECYNAALQINPNLVSLVTFRARPLPPVYVTVVTAWAVVYRTLASVLPAFNPHSSALGNMPSL